MTSLARDRSPLEIRAHRVVKDREARMRAMEARFRTVLSRIASASSVDYIHRLALVATCGTDPGTNGWSFTSRLLRDEQIVAFCGYCGTGLYGIEGERLYGCPMAEMCDGCPGEISEEIEG